MFGVHHVAERGCMISDHVGVTNIAEKYRPEPEVKPGPRMSAVAPSDEQRSSLLYYFIVEYTKLVESNRMELVLLSNKKQNINNY